MNLENYKFTTETNENYIIIKSIIIDDINYGLITNFDNQSESKFVKIDIINGNLIFEEIFDNDIIEQIIKA